MNRTSLIVVTLAAAALATTACTQKAGGSSNAGSSANVAVIDGHAISRKLYDEYVNAVSNGAANLTQQQKDGLLENLVRGQVLTQWAEANGADKEDKTQAALELQRLNILSQAATDFFLKDKVPTEAEMRAEYDERAAGMDRSEYRANHILVKTEDEAKKIIAQLKGGGNFAQIARAQSLDTSNKDKSGELDWFAPGAMTKPFADAVVSMKKGDTSATPVQTEFGWHVIRLTDTREATPPPFEEVKEQMAKAVSAKKTKAWVEDLMKKAKITKSL
jgi:peptidyl-prolyl cis-trans isomerase C